MKFRFSFKRHDQGRFYFLKSYLWVGRERKIHWHAVWWIKFTVTISEDGLCWLVLISNISNYQLHFLCVQCTLLYNTRALILDPVQYHTSLRLTTLKQDDTLIDFVANAIWTSFNMCLKFRRHMEEMSSGQLRVSQYVHLKLKKICSFSSM